MPRQFSGVLPARAREDKAAATTYHPSMDRSNPSAAKSASDVSAALVPRTAGVQDRLRTELALLAAQWLGPAVLRSAGEPP